MTAMDNIKKSFMARCTVEDARMGDHCNSCPAIEICIERGKMKNEHDYVSDRVSLEWLVMWCLSQDDPCISIGRGKELLGFMDMQEMRDFMNKNRWEKKENEKTCKTCSRDNNDSICEDCVSDEHNLFKNWRKKDALSTPIKEFHDKLQER